MTAVARMSVLLAWKVISIHMLLCDKHTALLFLRKRTSNGDKRLPLS